MSFTIKCLDCGAHNNLTSNVYETCLMCKEPLFPNNAKTVSEMRESMNATSTGGLKFDNTKPDMSLIPAIAAFEEAAVWTFGKTKYDAFNWHKGFKFNRVLAAIERHLTLLKAGIDLDEETKRHHAASIRCGCAMLVQFFYEGRADLDDRLQLDEATKARVLAMSKGETIGDILEDLKNG